MSDIYLFDVDGTLTPAKSKITPAFKKQFSRWMKDKEVYKDIVTILSMLQP